MHRATLLVFIFDTISAGEQSGIKGGGGVKTRKRTCPKCASAHTYTNTHTQVRVQTAYILLGKNSSMSLHNFTPLGLDTTTMHSCTLRLSLHPTRKPPTSTAHPARRPGAVEEAMRVADWLQCSARGWRFRSTGAPGICSEM